MRTKIAALVLAFSLIVTPAFGQSVFSPTTCAELTAAWAAIEAQGGFAVLNFPPGISCSTTGLYWQGTQQQPIQRVIIHGNNSVISLNSGMTGVKPVMAFAYVINVHAYDLLLNGNRYNVESTEWDAGVALGVVPDPTRTFYEFGLTEQITFTNVKVMHGGGDGIMLDGVKGVWFNGISIENFGRGAIGLIDAQNFHFTSMTVKNMTDPLFPGYGWGIDIEPDDPMFQFVADGTIKGVSSDGTAFPWLIGMERSSGGVEIEIPVQ